MEKTNVTEIRVDGKEIWKHKQEETDKLILLTKQKKHSQAGKLTSVFLMAFLLFL